MKAVSESILNPPRFPFQKPEEPRAWEPALLGRLDRVEILPSGGGSHAAGMRGAALFWD